MNPLFTASDCDMIDCDMIDCDMIDCDKCGTRINWKVDFSFEESGETVFAEAKGVETSDYRKKLKVWREKRPAALEIWKGSWQNPKLVERIPTPKKEAA